MSFIPKFHASNIARTYLKITDWDRSAITPTSAICQAALVGRTVLRLDSMAAPHPCPLGVLSEELPWLRATRLPRHPLQTSFEIGSSLIHSCQRYDREPPKFQSAPFKPARRSAHATLGPRHWRLKRNSKGKSSVLISLAPLLWLRSTVSRVPSATRRISTYYGVRRPTRISSLD